MRAGGYYSFNIIDNFTSLSMLNIQEIAEITNHTPNLLRLKGEVNEMTIISKDAGAKIAHGRVTGNNYITSHGLMKKYFCD